MPINKRQIKQSATAPSLEKPVKNAYEAIARAIAIQGFVVVGVLDLPDLLPGYLFFDFGQDGIWPDRLVVQKKTTRAEWDRQMLLFGLRDPSKKAKNQFFYRCTFEPSNSADATGAAATPGGEI